MEQTNLSYIETTSGDDKAFKYKLIEIIKSEFPLEKKVYFNNIESSNLKKTAEIVHKLKHKISILGLVKSFEIAVKYENNLNNNNTEGKDEFESILQLITDFLETL
mgnify:FL=1